MRSDTGSLVENIPASKVCLDRIGKFEKDAFDTDVMYQTHHVRHADEGDEGFLRREG